LISFNLDSFREKKRMSEQQVNNNVDYKERAKNVFETLDNLEAVHQNKRKNYERDDNNTNDDDSSVGGGDGVIVSAGEIYLNEEDEENSHSNSQQKILRKHPQQADHVVNPHKYKKYSLEDVDDNKLSGRANTQAAINFLTSLKNRQPQNDDEEEEDNEDVEEEEEEDDDVEEIDDNSQQQQLLVIEGVF
jgi:hypothetical protein